MPRTETAQPDRGFHRESRFSRYLVPRDTPHYAELAAAVAVAAVLAHLLLAQLTLLLAVGMYLTGRVSRWRLQWLAAPAGAGLVWTLAIGVPRAAADFAAGPRQVVGYLAGLGGHPGHLLGPQDAFAGLPHWLPVQFPLALILAAAEIAAVTWLQRRRRGDIETRAGLIVAVRRWLTTVTLRSGGVATRDGAILGVDVASGRPAAISWREAAGGVLCAGADAGAPPDRAQDGFCIAWAAIRRRKPVIIVDLGGSPELAESLAAACAESRAPFSRFSPDGPGHYEPLRGGDPARAARLVCAMIDWSDVSDQQRRSCSAYLTDALAVLAATPVDRRVPVLDDLAGLLTPAGLRARAALIPPYHPRREVLADRAAVSAGLLQADPAIVAATAEQVAMLRESALGRWLRPEPPEPGRMDPVRISLGLTIRDRAVTLFSLDRAAHGTAAKMIAALVVADLIAVGAELEDMSVPGDGLIWINGCDGLAQQAQSELIAPLMDKSRGAGMAVVVSTTSAVARNLAASAAVLVADWPVDPGLASAFAGAAEGAGTGSSAASGASGAAAADGSGPGPYPAAELGGTVPAVSGRALTGAEFALLVGPGAAVPANGGLAAGVPQPRVLPHCRSVPAWPGEPGLGAAGSARNGSR